MLQGPGPPPRPLPRTRGPRAALCFLSAPRVGRTAVTAECARPHASPRASGHSDRRPKCHPAPTAGSRGPGRPEDAGLGGGRSRSSLGDGAALTFISWRRADTSGPRWEQRPLRPQLSLTLLPPEAIGCRQGAPSCGRQWGSPHHELPAARRPLAGRSPSLSSVKRVGAAVGTGAPGRSSQVTWPSPVIGTCSRGGLLGAAGEGGEVGGFMLCARAHGQAQRGIRVNAERFSSAAASACEMHLRCSC